MTTRARLIIAATLAAALTAVVLAERASEERANRPTPPRRLEFGRPHLPRAP